MLITLLSILLALFLNGCATPDAPVTVQPTPLPAPTRARPEPREPGSLWSERSTWNEIYSPAATRAVGESLTLKVGKILKNKIIAMEPEEAKAQREAKKESHLPQRDLASGAGLIVSPDATNAEMVIEEVLPHQILRVSLNQALKVDGREPLVSLDGMVRERDVAEDNTFPSDALFNLKLNADFPSEEKTRSEKDKKAETEKRAVSGSQRK